MSQVPLLNIMMVPAGVDLVIQALSKLPYEQSAGLIAEIKGQAAFQLQPPAPPEPAPPADDPPPPDVVA